MGVGEGRMWGLSNPSSLQITNNYLLRTSTNYLRMLNQMNIFALETWSEQHICRWQEQKTGWKNILQQGNSASVRMGRVQKLNCLIAVHIITLPVAHTVRRQWAMTWTGCARARLQCYPETSWQKLKNTTKSTSGVWIWSGGFRDKKQEFHPLNCYIYLSIDRPRVVYCVHVPHHDKQTQVFIIGDDDRSNFENRIGLLST